MVSGDLLRIFKVTWYKNYLYYWKYMLVFEVPYLAACGLAKQIPFLELITLDCHILLQHMASLAPKFVQNGFP
jgi:hypothetical protein